MRRFAWAAVLLCAGCYAAHPREGGDAGSPDARRTDTGGAPPDAGTDATRPPADAPPDALVSPDAACMDVAERSTRVCVLTPTGTIPAEEPYTLRVERSLCLCEARSCDVRVSGERIDLALRTCAGDVLCSECTTEAECPLPPMPEGTRQLWVDGVFAGSVRAEPRRMVTEAQPACWAIPERPDESLVCTANVVERPGPSQLCHRMLEDVGTHVAFELTLECAGCFDWSAGCEAIRESSRSVLLRPRLQACDCPSCGACEPGVCFPQVVRCQTPPLRDGLYDVTLEGADGARVTASRLEIRDVAVPGPASCVPLP